MANNPYVNKVMKSDGTTIMDISDSTVTADKLAQGYRAYNSAGEQITGTAKIIEPLENWEQLQQKVRTNDMSDISISDQFQCYYGDMPDMSIITWDVIGKNQDEPNDTNYSNTLTLRTHYLSEQLMEFDVSEAFYWCSSRLPAKKYYIKIGGTYYNFTLTQPVPQGGQLVFNKINSQNIQIISYPSATSITPIEIVQASTGYASSDTNLGSTQNDVTNGNVNAYNRIIFGYGSYKDSVVRQWLNSDKPAGQWWTPQNKWDRPPDIAGTINGFIYNLDSDFLSVIGATKKTTARNSYEGGSYITSDKFFLLSQTEVYGGNAISSIPENQPYQFYSQNSSLPEPGTGQDTNRYAYTSAGTNGATYLRTPQPSNSGYVKRISGGSIGEIYAMMTSRVLIACNII